MTTHTRLDTRTARLKLKPQGKPYRTKIGDRLDLAYRPLKDAPGSWSLRRYDGKGYALEQFAVADDMDEADGIRTLTFHQAQAKARGLDRLKAERERLAADGPPLTVAGAAIEPYVEMRGALRAVRAGARSATRAIGWRSWLRRFSRRRWLS